MALTLYDAILSYNLHMNGIAARISSKKQISIPAEIRRRLNLDTSDHIVFVVADDGTITVKRPEMTLEEVFGSWPAPRPMSSDLRRETEEAWAEAVDAKVGRWRRQGIS